MTSPGEAGRRRAAVSFIVSMEACERFSFYGLVSILTLYLNRVLGATEAGSKEAVHLFKVAVYFLPLLGGVLADRWLGRHRTILALSLFYCLGHGVIAATDASATGLWVGLGLIALGAGGIKPCVSAFVGDQFGASASERLPFVYGLFYWSINLGAMFGFALVPWVRDHWGYRWAFGVPGVLMGIAFVCFLMGSRWYVRVPVAPAPAQGGGTDLRTVGRIALVLAPVPVFWALYDQINSSWVLQGARMQPFALAGFKVDAERIQSASALLVLLWIPVLTLGVYPFLERRGLRLTPLRRMGAGMVFAALSFVVCAWLEWRLQRGESLTLGWQLFPYTVIELGEVLLSATGLEYAYSQAPERARGLVMSLWLCTTSVGNFLVAAVTFLNSRYVHAQGVAEFLFYAVLMLAVSGVFVLIARRGAGKG